MATKIRRSRILLAIVVLGAACGDDATSPDGAMPDGSMPDSALDGRGFDARLPDGAIDMDPPDWGDSMLVTSEMSIERVTLRWDAATDPSAPVTYTLFRDGSVLENTTTLMFHDESVTADTSYTYSLIATDAAGNATTSGPSLFVSTGLTTPDPLDVVPVLDPDDSPTFHERVSFLWEGDPAVQIGVADGAIESRRVSVLRGRVVGDAGVVLAGVTVRVLSQNGAGMTTTRDDGRYDIAFNGGGRTTVTFEATGLLRSQRSLITSYNEFYELDDVQLVAQSTIATAVSFEAAMVQVARAETQGDSSGERTPTLMVPAGASATAILEDGTSVPVAAGSVRITEYTIGTAEEGMRRMPGSLPSETAYTHAIELSLDEAEAMGAVRVEFSEPLFYYVENFVGFDVGDFVPSGYYDRVRGIWIGSESGRVIEVVGVTGGMAEVDVDGDGAGDDDATLTELGFTDAERTQIASLYTTGQQLWRAPIPHFTPWDHNWGVAFPPGATPPEAQGVISNNEGDRDPCAQPGSEIWCQHRALGERITIPGTTQELLYNSIRARGNTAQRTFEALVMGDVPDVPPKRVEIETRVLGASNTRRSASIPNLRHRYVWDGQDVYGNEVYGAVNGDATITYVYDADYTSTLLPRGFNRVSGVTVAMDSSRGEISASQRVPFTVVRHPEDPDELGHWTLAGHHRMDPTTGAIFWGDGRVRQGSIGITHVAGRVTLHARGTPSSTRYPTDGDGGPASEAGLRVNDLAVAPDGTIYTLGTSRIRRITPDGIISTYAGGNGVGRDGDGGLAVDAQISGASIAVGLEGEVYLLQFGADLFGDSRVIRVIRPDGIIERFAGIYERTVDLGEAANVDGMRKEDASFYEAASIEMGPDGTLHVAGRKLLASIHTDGYVEQRMGETRIAGLNFGEDTLAVNWTAGPLSPIQMNVDDESRIYLFASRTGGNGRQIRVDGAWAHPYWLGPEADLRSDDFEFGQDTRSWGGLGEIHALAPFGFVGRDLLGIDHRGRAIPFHATPTTFQQRQTGYSYSGDDGPLSAARFYNPVPYSGRGNALYISDQNKHVIRRVIAQPRGRTTVLSDDGLQRFVFEVSGLHRETWDVVRNVRTASFAYADGRLSAATDARGLVTQFERDAAGALSAIVAPDGVRTEVTLDADGHLASLAMPEGRAYAMEHTEGLLMRFEEPTSRVTTFTYDDGGALVSESRGGDSATLSQESIVGGRRVLFTSMAGRETAYDITTPEGVGVVHTSVQADGVGVLSFTRAPAGGESITWPNGATGQIEYRIGSRPGERRLASMTASTPSGLSREETFDFAVVLADEAIPDGELSSMVVTRTLAGNATTSAWDGSTRSSVVTNPTGQSMTLQLDAEGRPSRVERSGLSALRMTHDTQGRPLTLQWDALQTSVAYDDAAHTTHYTDANGGVWSDVHNVFGESVSVMSPEGAQTLFARDGLGNLDGVTMPSGDTTSIDRHSSGRISAFMRPSGATWTMERSADGDLLSVTHPSGRTSTNMQDAVGRTLTQAADVTREFTYVGDTERYQSATYRSGADEQTLAFEYDGPLRTSTAFGGASVGTFTSTWDSSFRLTGFGLDAGAPTVITRDAAGRRTSHGPYVFVHSGPGGTPSNVSGGDLNEDLTFDARARLVGKSFTVGTFSYGFSLTRDALGNAMALTEFGSGDRLHAYEYNADSWLIAESEGGARVAFTYDVNANLTSNGAELIAHDIDDGVVSIGAEAVVYSQDGQLVSKGADTFVYSSHHDLRSATVGGTTVRYVNDALHRRTAIIGATTTTFLYGDAERESRMTHADGPEGSSEYFYNELGHVVAMHRDGIAYYIATDQVGSPRFVVNGTGTIMKELRYNAWGEMVMDSSPGFALHVGFASGLFDPHTGWTTFWMRDYDPEIGRFTTIDSSLYTGGRPNLFAYADNNPVARIDPAGLFSFGIEGHLGIIGGELEIAYSDGAISTCIGVGAGTALGFGATVDPMGAAEITQDFIKVEAGASVMGYGVDISSTWADVDCGDGRIIEDVFTSGVGMPTSLSDYFLGLLNGPVEFGVEVGTKIISGQCVRHEIW